MTAKDAVKKSGTPVALAGASIDAADQLIVAGEAVRHAVAANCTIDGTSKANGALVVTSHRILFCSSTMGKVWSHHLLLGDCVGLGDITGKVFCKLKISAEGSSIVVELTREQLAALQAAILAAVEEYPNQQPINFPSPAPAPAPAPAQAKPKPAAPTITLPPSKRQITAQRKADAKAQGLACCPKCGSTSLSAQKKGFGAGKAAAGVFLTGGLAGALAGGIGANKVEVTCLACGHKFKPGQ